MAYIYFDESHHKRGDFTLGAFVLFDRDPGHEIEAAIARVGLRPGVDEYKSRQPHATDPRWGELRSSLFRLAGGCRIGLMVATYPDRTPLGVHVLAALAHILRENLIAPPVTVHLDQGLFRSDLRLEQWRKEVGLPEEVELKVECDSRAVHGIQVADLVAHACSIALLGRMGVADKTIWDEEEGEYQLSFEMWARLRYNFLTRELTDPEQQEAASAGLMDSRGGLYVAPGCSALVAERAQDRFGQTWLGCIH